MKKNNFLLLLMLIAAQTIAAQDIEESYKIISNKLCNEAIKEKAQKKEYMSLNLASSKLLNATCTLTEKTALNDCFPKLVNIYKGYIQSKEKTKAANLTKKGLEFCSAYADISGVEIINIILNDALEKKITVDQAAENLLKSSAPQK